MYTHTQARVHAAHSLDWAPVSGVSSILPMTCRLSKALNASGACSNGNLHHMQCDNFNTCDTSHEGPYCAQDKMSAVVFLPALPTLQHSLLIHSSQI